VDYPSAPSSSANAQHNTLLLNNSLFSGISSALLRSFAKCHANSPTIKKKNGFSSSFFFIHYFLVNNNNNK